jgi:hypothetical protein
LAEGVAEGGIDSDTALLSARAGVLVQQTAMQRGNAAPLGGELLRRRFDM